LDYNKLIRNNHAKFAKNHHELNFIQKFMENRHELFSALPPAQVFRRMTRFMINVKPGKVPPAAGQPATISLKQPAADFLPIR
jgi:hypothetical protein